MQQIQPGFMTRQRAICPECNGNGKSILEKDRCPDCKGEQVIEETFELEIIIQRGMATGDVIRYPGKGDHLVCSSFFF